MRDLEGQSEVEIRQEARFVLWALRCCELNRHWDNSEVQAEIVRGFELADVLETLPTFRKFALNLHALATGVVWHGPACSCVSAGEMHVLHALAQVADHQRESMTTPAHWWRLLVPSAQQQQVDELARRWLAELQRAGIEYPGTVRLIEALTPLQFLMDDSPEPRAMLN